MLESEIQSRILQYLKKQGIFHFKTQSTNISGIPDIVCIYSGVPLFLEVKQPKGKLSKLQEYQMDKIRQAGGYAFVVTSVTDIPSILHSLKEDLDGI